MEHLKIVNSKLVKTYINTCVPFRRHQKHLCSRCNSTIGPPPQPSSISTTDQTTWMSNHTGTWAFSQSMFESHFSSVLLRGTTLHTEQQCWAAKLYHSSGASLEAQKYLQ